MKWNPLSVDKDDPGRWRGFVAIYIAIFVAVLVGVQLFVLLVDPFGISPI